MRLKNYITIAILFLVLASPSAGIKKVLTLQTISAKSSIPFSDFIEPSASIEKDYVEITLTRFYPNDSTGSDKCMATMCVTKLKINSKGWYTYEGKVVLAAATYLCQAKCKNRATYGPLPSDYRIYNFYDEITFVLENVEYTGIILDSCGACMYHINGESLQRYDIYTASGKQSSSLLSKGNVGKTTAQLLIHK